MDVEPRTEENYRRYVRTATATAVTPTRLQRCAIRPGATARDRSRRSRRRHDPDHGWPLERILLQICSIQVQLKINTGHG